MIDRCPHCPIPPEKRCLALQPICERVADPEFRKRFAEHHAGVMERYEAEADAAIAIGATSTLDSIPNTGGGCCP